MADIIVNENSSLISIANSQEQLTVSNQDVNLVLTEAAPAAVNISASTVNVVITEENNTTSVLASVEPVVRVMASELETVSVLMNPIFTYDNERRLVYVEWDNGYSKEMIWNGDQLVQTVFTQDSLAIEKTYNYSNGLLISISEEVA
jgi:hypothetical protein